MTPFECWKAAGGDTSAYDPARWRRLMAAHGHPIPVMPAPARHLRLVSP